MKTTVALTFSMVALFCTSAHAATFDWAIVGNPFNSDDVTGYGGVDYAYRISKHEVTNAQYTEFLNAVDPTGANTLSLFSSTVAVDWIGIENTGAVDGERYIAKPGREHKPVVYVSFVDAMRFTNWLHNGKGSGGTETGAYTIGNGAGTDEVRSANAKYWIPSEDEWYKAAYYSPDGVYYNFPTGTDTQPYSDNPSSLNTPDDTNVANFYKYNGGLPNGYDDGHAVSGSVDYPRDSNPFTEVGDYTSAVSPYGTFDQGGNVWEWNETVIDSTWRLLRGGAWDSRWNNLHAGFRDYERLPRSVSHHIGFRVATVVPEPGSVAFGTLAAMQLLMLRRV